VTTSEPDIAPATTRSRRAARPTRDAAAALSGLAWSGLAYALAREVLGDAIWGGILASPVIGVVVGRLFHPFDHATVGRLLSALASLYFAVALFGIAVGATEWILNPYPERNGPALVVQNLLGCLAGITFTGLVVAFWPLCILNHGLLRRIGG